MKHPEFPEPSGTDAGAAWSGGLSALSTVPLADAREAVLAAVSAGCAGNAAWKRRKYSEFRELLALDQVSGRIEILQADLSIAIRVLFRLRCPVPTMPVPGGDLVVADSAVIGLTYPEEAVRMPQPGFAFLGLLEPNHVWLPNVAPPDPAFPRIGPGQALCLGVEVAAGTPVKELILSAYEALTMQSIQLDERDHAGIMNKESASWYLMNRSRIPLTREGFLPAKPSREPC
jgi:hypothetical protein